MRSWLVVIGAGLTLSGCVGIEQRYYAADRFQTMPWARKSFEAARAGCRYDNIRKDDFHALNTGMYQACMEKQGFRYRAGNGGMYDDLPPPSQALPVTPAITAAPDNAALYQ